MDTCHCGRPTAWDGATPMTRAVWVELGTTDPYWRTMPKELCQECWDTRCDLGGGCP